VTVAGATGWRDSVGAYAAVGAPAVGAAKGDDVLPSELTGVGAQAGALLKARGETVAVAEGSCGGLVSAALLAVPGASAYYVGGTVIYTLAASKAFVAGAIPTPPKLRGATEPFAAYLAEAVSVKLGTTWGIGEGGAAGPGGNAYGDPSGHAWLAVHGPRPGTRHLLTGLDDRERNMVAFATAALALFVRQLEAA
jgi:PncC family amidohydrolase